MDAKTAINEAVKSDIDKNNFKKGKDNFFKYNGKENTPSGYEDTVDAYFKSLAEGEEEWTGSLWMINGFMDWGIIGFEYSGNANTIIPI